MNKFIEKAVLEILAGIKMKYELKKPIKIATDLDREENNKEFKIQTISEIMKERGVTSMLDLIRNSEKHADDNQYLLDFKKNRIKFLKREEAERQAVEILKLPHEEIVKFVINAVSRRDRDRIIMRDIRRHHIEILHDLCRETHDVPCEHTEALYEVWYDVPSMLETACNFSDYFEYEMEK